MEGHALGAALSVADRLGVLPALAETPSSPAELAGRMELDAGGLALVLEVLRTQGLLERIDDRYQVTDAVRAELAGPSMGRGEVGAFWALTEELVRTGRTQLTTRSSGDRETVYSTATSGLGRMFGHAASLLGEHVAAELGADASPHILDVGAGAGVWSLSMAERLPGARVTALDLPGVLPTFLESSDAKALAARVDVIGGDYHTVPLPREPYDLCVLANVLHLEGPRGAAAMIRRFARAVRPEGMLVVVDCLSDGSEPAERRRAAYALHLGMRVAGGHPHAVDVLRRWLADAGRSRVEQVDLSEGYTGIGALLAR